MKTWMWSILLSLLMSADSNTCAEDLYIGDFSANGRITWNDSYTTGFYRVEWASSITQEIWSTNWSELSSIRGTGGDVTADVPMFYRVVFTPDTFPWGELPLEAEYWSNSSSDSSWSFSSNAIVRDNNSIQSQISFTQSVPHYFTAEFSLQPLGIGGSDGKGISISSSSGGRQVFINDGYPYVIQIPGGATVDYATSPAITTNTVYNFLISVSPTNITAQINSIHLSADWLSSPPYSITFQAQRTGYILTNIIYNPR